jgi:hypothetical protein
MKNIKNYAPVIITHTPSFICYCFNLNYFFSRIHQIVQNRGVVFSFLKNPNPKKEFEWSLSKHFSQSRSLISFQCFGQMYMV